MASPQVGVVSTQDLTTLFTAVDTAFSQISFDEQTIADKISFLKSGIAGKEEVVPFSPVGGKEVTWQLGDQRKVVSPLIYQCRVINERIAPPDEQAYMATLDWDAYGVLKGKLQQMMSRSKRVWDRRLATTMLANPTGFDGVSLWNTAHPVNPNEPAFGTYSNDISNVDIDEAGLATVLDALKKIKWMDNNILNAYDDGLVLVVPTMSLYIKARKFIFGTLTPQAGPAANTSVAASNPYQGLGGMIKDVFLLPELDDGTLANQKRWYVLNCSSPALRPLITSVVHQPIFHYSGLNPNDYPRVQYGAVLYGWEANGGCAAGLPQLTVRGNLP